MALKSAPAPEAPPTFDDAITSLKGYPSLDNVPRVMFRRLNQIMRLEEISLDDACEAISARIGFSRDAIREKLEAFPSTYRRMKNVRRAS